ncbi:MarR family winged helix-turn-helix transcriptional regulator [Paenibacillus apiarius]|uniref:MarR family transcriptional regulator n=2 Tax=Paenibacillus apiarius TaxID=46240 RepID=A0ABT4DUR0_9BACL|nr:MarR family transcriptional regulator [Paenibacillus apiarius]MBN3523401.1 MarR family transcriptional regulator [Paenibacillus apiarius]MCY9514380.1 MarR family transcriptional regulator [Paenibacillus apiarius]MCY9521082.1 MarR family transcriptional regulator [Paenibacillus apiarius]MCY9551929.1 MarR family transcriptional regulator [Paenibacillus apiarius]MCY9557816.1 MarR family transcriptional regulator [Paenibacillus apiarius]
MTTHGNGLEHSIGFAMGVTYRKLSNLLQQRLKEHDITPEQWSVLYQISRANGLIQKEIAERAGKDKPTTTRILDHLERKGLIYKKIGENDRRSFLVNITDNGMALIQRTAPIERQAADDIKQCVSNEEYEVLMELLLRIGNHVNELTDRE